ncbi:MAG: nuclear transport factor 2 family protein [Acidobacteria bacterium]|nr:nuclear transport factor 2 family protein [Acidobacteriota bacterium]
MKTFILFVATCFATTMLTAASADEQAVRAAMEKFNEASRKGDGATLEKLIHPDIVYSHSNAKEETKAEAIAALVKSKNNFEFQPGWTVKVYGNTAILRVKAVAKSMNNGQPTTTPLSMLLVWIKVGNGWQMVGRQTTRLPQ